MFVLLNLDKWLKHMLLHCGWDANPCVVNPDMQIGKRHIGTKFNVALACKFTGIVEQI